jgi:hypothetical protein
MIGAFQAAILASGGGSTIKTPAEISSARLWLDYSDLSVMWQVYNHTTQATAGSVLGSIQNKVGGGEYWATWDGGGNTYKPTVNASATGATFDGINDYLATPRSNLTWMADGNPDIRIYAVTAPNVVTGNRAIFTIGYNALGMSLQFAASKLAAWIGNGAGTFTQKSSTASVSTGLQLSEFEFSNTGDIVLPVINNDVRTDTGAFTGNLGYNAGDILACVGATTAGYGAAIAWPFGGDQLEIVGLLSPSAQDVTDTIAYLANHHPTLTI